MNKMPGNPSKLANKKLTLFIYRAKGASCHPTTLHDKIHGYSEIRIKKDAQGRTERKKYSYPGIPHHRLMRGGFVTDLKNAPIVEALFNRFGVSYIKCPAPVFVQWEVPHEVG